MSRRRHPERGAIAVTTMLLLGALLGFFALAFNTGLIMDSRSELQNGSDSAALAAARSLNGESSGLTSARTSAYDYSMSHLAYDQQITIDTGGSDLVFGRWHMLASECTYGSGTPCFEPISSTEPRKINAVKILNGRDGAATHNPLLDLPFGFFVGAATARVGSVAVAVGGGPGIVKCSMPFTIAECKIVDPNTNQMNCNSGPMRVTFSNSNNDGLGFANLYYPDDNQAPSGNFVADILSSGKTCNPNNFEVAPAKIQEGNDFNDKVIDALRGVDNKGNAKDGATCYIGKTMSWAVTADGCPGNPIFHGVQDVVGFVKAKIVEVTDQNGIAYGCPGETVPPVVPADGKAGRSIVVEITCGAGADPTDIGGGRAYNASNVRTRLVQ
jgi:hypothetical protein